MRVSYCGISQILREIFEFRMARALRMRSRQFCDLIQSEFTTSLEMVSSNQAGPFNYPAFTKTTYASDFTFPEHQPISRFHNYVSFVLDTKDKFVPRCFPHFALHVSPHRILEYERSAVGFSPTGAEYVDTEQSEQEEADVEQTQADEEKTSSTEGYWNNLNTEGTNSKKEEREEADSKNQEDEKTLTHSLEKQSLENFQTVSI